MDQRVALIRDWLCDDWTVSELATRYGVSRKTAHKTITRYVLEGSVDEYSRAPRVHGRVCDTALRAAVLALRRQFPHRGPKKLREMLSTREPTRAWPAASTIGDWLRAARLSTPRRRRRYVVPLSEPLAAAAAPNDVWTADFKGWFHTRDGTRCDPLTIIDAHSRFLLCCQLVAPTEAGVWRRFDRTFRAYGLPRALRTDNGAPFAGHGPGRLSRLAVWWLKLGIRLDRIDPGHPEQNGRHERFHLTLKQEAIAPAAPTARAQQQRFDKLRTDFNTTRPHEALGQRPPARLYVPSRRSYPVPLMEPCYQASDHVRRVKKMGAIVWQGEEVFISKAVRGELIALTETECGDWRVRFMHIELGRIDRVTRRFTPAWYGRRIG